MAQTQVAISACIVANNEASHIEEALASLHTWVNQIIVINNGSTDATPAIARQYTNHIITTPHTPHANALRNMAVEHAQGGWLFYLDADERVPSGLAEALPPLLENIGQEYAAVYVPCKHYFCGKWLRHGGWWPGYSRPQFLKKGCFRFHEGASASLDVQGKNFVLPADNPELAIVRHVYDSIEHYLEKLARSLEGEAEHLLANNHLPSCQAALTHFVQDWQRFHDGWIEDSEDSHGFYLALFSAMSRLLVWAKLWEKQRLQDVGAPGEHIPGSFRNIMEYMARLTQEGGVPLSTAHSSTTQAGEIIPPAMKQRPGFPLPQREPLSPTTQHEPPAVSAKPSLPPFRLTANPVPTDWPNKVDFLSALGRALRVHWEADIPLASPVARAQWELCLELQGASDTTFHLNAPSQSRHDLSARFEPLLETLPKESREAPDVTVRHLFPPGWKRNRTDKLVLIQPGDLSQVLEPTWLEGALYYADEVWVHTRYGRDMCVRMGVPGEKIHIIPYGVRPPVLLPSTLPSPRTQKTRFLFAGTLTVDHGIDVLIKAYQQAFSCRDDVCLVISDRGSGTSAQEVYWREAVRHAQASPTGPDIDYQVDSGTDAERHALYHDCTCMVLPYRAQDGGCMPLEGMACALPLIVTANGPLEDYVDDTLALRVPSRRGVTEVPAPVGAEIWQPEPDQDYLAQALLWMHAHPDLAAERGQAARQRVRDGWTWERAHALLRERLHALCAPKKTPSSSGITLWSEPSSRRAKPKKGNKIAVSLCLIARNEEPRIGACLQSIAPYVDEMVVVDTGSTDRTREIARDCGARVFAFPWTDSFSEARNQSLAQARGDWIFWMDADDVISPDCGMQLRELIRQNPARDVAYQVQVRIPPGSGEFSFTVVDHVKLFPNHPDIRFEHRIHEQILPALRRAGVEVRFSDLYVTHAHYDRSEAGQTTKRLRDFRLLQLDLAERPDHPFVLFNLGMTYLFATKEFEMAAHFLRRSLAHSDWRDSIVRKAYALLTTGHMCQHDWERALTANEEGRGYYPEDAELLFQAGQLYQRYGRLEEAQQTLEQLLYSEEPPHYRSVDTSLHTFRGKHELALVLRKRGNTQQAEGLLQQCLSEQPDYVPAYRDLIELLVETGRRQEAALVLNQIPQADGFENDLDHLRRYLGVVRP